MATFTHVGQGPAWSVPADPDARLVYGAAWDDWLDAGDSISTSIWGSQNPIQRGATQTDVSVVVDGVQYDHVNTVLLWGFTEGGEFEVSNTVTAAGSGETTVRSMIIPCASQ